MFEKLISSDRNILSSNAYKSFYVTPFHYTCNIKLKGC